ncbi:PAS domain-containing protein [Halococcoides cellulosivorans]|uniref:histidine kinase n=1 Tax=Halococcoides cellulosivorans TaxID=1679096 RepID=A0A2R4WYQ1_9EURY|nr:PAS domain-containing protein [Halococcoides cellulosivorans]AWB26655.1 hypothetical protein HARCEL1_02475 [Halococcoides cellulosivorans]
MPTGTDQSTTGRESADPRGVPTVVVESTGTIEFASDNWLDRTGYEYDAVMGHPIEEFFAGRDGVAILESCLPMGGSVSGGTFDLELADESIERVHVAAIPEYDETGAFVRTHCQFPDLSARLDATTSHVLRYRLFDLAPVGIFQTTVDGDVLRINPELAAMLGCDSVEDVLETYQDLTTDLYVDPSTRQEFLDQLHETGSVTDFEYEARRADGASIWLSMNASLTGQLPDGTGVISGFVLDVSERRRHRQELAEERERYSTLVRQSPDGIAIVRDGRIEFVNDRATDILARDRSTLEGRPIAALTAQPDRLPDCEHADDCLEGRPAIEVDFHRPNGSIVPVELHAAAIHLDGQPASLYIFRDISDRRERERHLRVLDRILRHTIRNRMTVIRGYAELIANDPTADVADLAQIIVGTADDLVDLADMEREIVELLTDRPTVEPVDLSAMIDRVTRRARRAFPESQLRVTCPDDLTVLAIPRLESGLYQLVENGLDHADQDAPTVTISVGGTDTVRIRIVDEGPGLPPTAQSILEGAAEVDPLFHGRGLGLWLAHHAIDRSGGSVETRTDENGTVVEIELQRL